MEKTSSPSLSQGQFIPLAIFGILALCLGTVATLVRAPAEDAVILHQYSKNLADTGVISYIPGGRPAEGATDFLWMLYIALGMKLKIAPVLSTAIANVACALGLSYVLLRLANKSFQWMPALAIVGVLALTPQTLAAVAGFSVLPFGLLIATTVFYSDRGNDRGTAISALLLCLLRPDGVVFAVPLIVRRLWLSRSNAKSWIAYAIFFVIPGALYFLWRWHYFQHFLPLPFLVKSDTKRFMGIFAPDSQKLIPYLAFDLIAIVGAIGAHIKRSRELSLLVAIVIVPALFYSMMRLDQNVFDRFYYFIPLAAAIVIAQDWDRPAWGRGVLILSLACAFLLCLFRIDISAVREYQYISGYWRRNEDIARQLSAMRGVLLTSEAGEFAYFSRWNVYDSWGLDTPEYAVHLIQPQDVVNLSPDLIALHTEPCRPVAASAETYRSMENMNLNVKTGVALQGNYDTWSLVLPSRHVGGYQLKLCFYVRRDYSDNRQVEQILSSRGAIPGD